MSFNLKKSSPPSSLPSTLEAMVGGRTVLVRVSRDTLKCGISPLSNRSRKVYDAGGPESWPIIEVGKNDNPNRNIPSTPSTLEATVGGRTVLVRVSMEDKQVSSQIGVRGVVPHRPCARLSLDRPGCLIDVARGDSSSSEFNRALFSFPSKSSHPALPKHAQGICAQAWYLAAIEALAQGVRRVDRGVGASHRSVVREGRRRRCRWAGIVADHRGWEERRPQPHYPVNPVDP